MISIICTRWLFNFHTFWTRGFRVAQNPIFGIFKMQPKIVVMLLLGTPGHIEFGLLLLTFCIALRVGGLKGKKKCTKYWLGYVWGWVEWARLRIWWDIVWNTTAKICNHPHYDIVFVIVWTDFEQACKITLGQMNQNSGDVFHCNMLLLLFFRED